jgi:outer membrane protein OmpA-like peptidoglycan-associated protein
MRILFTLLLLLFVVGMAQAQDARLKKAKKYMDRGNYQEAVKIYVDILNKSDDSEAKKNIAECYRALNNTHEMEYWYGQVVLLPQADDKAMLYLSQAKLANGKYEESRKWIDLYLKKYPDDIRGQMVKKATMEETIQNLKTSGVLYKVENVKELNSEFDDFCPAYQGKGKLVFTSSRDKSVVAPRTDARTGNPFTELFVATVNEKGELQYSYGKPEKFAKKLNHKYHDGPACFSADGKQIYLTRSSQEGKGADDIIRPKIYKADGSDQSWANPIPLPFNDNDYSVAHPSLSPDGKSLYFASNMPGGFGGYDLYVSYLVNDRWEPPLNLGPSVNTEGNEVFPFIHADSSLYFASDGLAGMGGLDIYRVEQLYGYWQTPTNLGYPVNSNADDFGMILNERKTHGYFSSSREGGSGGDDIYSFKKLSFSVEVIVFDQVTQTILPNADVFCSCAPLRSYKTDDEGKAKFDIPMDKACDFAAEINGYKPNSIRKNPEGMQAGDLLVVQIPLKQEIIYDLSGKITDGYTNQALEGALVRLISNCDNKIKEDQTLSDRDGRYEFKDLSENCDYRIVVSKSNYTQGLVTFSTHQQEPGKTSIEQNLVINCTGQDCPGKEKNPDNIGGNGSDTYDPKDFSQKNAKELDTIRMPNGDIKIINRKTGVQKIIKADQSIVILNSKGDTLQVIPAIGKPELVHIFYDYDDAAIREDAQPGLDLLVNFMEQYPEAKVLISSHTDARGPGDYNNRLSNRRAESAVAYLIQKGVAKNRLKAKGMGERVMINECYDGVQCSEEKHQENRRTEFIVYDYDASKAKTQSKKPATIKVNPCTNCDGQKKENTENIPTNNQINK